MGEQEGLRGTLSCPCSTCSRSSLASFSSFGLVKKLLYRAFSLWNTLLSCLVLV